jgi:hypothetical protein
MKPRFRIFFKNDVYKFTGYDLIHSHFLMSVIDGVLIGDVCCHFWYDMNGKLVEVQENRI